MEFIRQCHKSNLELTAASYVLMFNVRTTFDDELFYSMQWIKYMLKTYYFTTVIKKLIEL